MHIWGALESTLELVLPPILGLALPLVLLLILGLVFLLILEPVLELVHRKIYAKADIELTTPYKVLCYSKK